MVGMTRSCMHFRCPEGEDLLSWHKRTWLLAKQALLDSWGAPSRRGLSRRVRSEACRNARFGPLAPCSAVWFGGGHRPACLTCECSHAGASVLGAASEPADRGDVGSRLESTSPGRLGGGAPRLGRGESSPGLSLLPGAAEMIPTETLLSHPRFGRACPPARPPPSSPSLSLVPHKFSAVLARARAWASPQGHVVTQRARTAGARFEAARLGRTLLVRKCENDAPRQLGPGVALPGSHRSLRAAGDHGWARLGQRLPPLRRMFGFMGAPRRQTCGPVLP